MGPGLAMALYGGNLAEGEQTKPWMSPVIRLNAWIYNRFNFNNSSIANSSLTRALEQRLYFDHYYDMAMLKIVAAFSNKSAEVDSKVIDGAVKNNNCLQSLSSIVRSLTTGSARDYILMVSVGTLAIFFLLGGLD